MPSHGWVVLIIASYTDCRFSISQLSRSPSAPPLKGHVREECRAYSGQCLTFVLSWVFRPCSSRTQSPAASPRAFK